MGVIAGFVGVVSVLVLVIVCVFAMFKKQREKNRVLEESGDLSIWRVTSLDSGMDGITRQYYCIFRRRAKQHALLYLSIRSHTLTHSLSLSLSLPPSLPPSLPLSIKPCQAGVTVR